MILVLDHASGFGGGQTVLMQIVAHLERVKAPFKVLLPRGGRRHDELSKSCPDHLESLPPNHPKRPWDLIRLNAGLALHPTIWEPDTQVYINGTRLLPFVLMRARMTPFKKVAVHLHLEPNGLVLRLLRSLMHMQPETVLLCCSDYVLEQTRGLLPNANVRLLENALSSDYAACAAQPATITAPNGPMHIGIVGGIDTEKGQDIIARMPADLVNRCTIHLIGPEKGPAAWLETLKASAPPNIIFAGPQSDVPRYYEQHNIEMSVVPSRWAEPFGLVAIEGMALGTLTTLRAVGNLPRIASKTGAFTFGSDEDFYAQLRDVLDMPFAARRTQADLQRHQTLTTYGHYKIDAALADLGMTTWPES